MSLPEIHEGEWWGTEAEVDIELVTDDPERYPTVYVRYDGRPIDCFQSKSEVRVRVIVCEMYPCGIWAPVKTRDNEVMNDYEVNKL